MKFIDDGYSRNTSNMKALKRLTTAHTPSLCEFKLLSHAVVALRRTALKKGGSMLLGSAVVLLTGCVSSPKLVTSKAGPVVPAATANTQVHIYPYGEAVPEPYTILGKVTYSQFGARSVSKKRAEEFLRREAAKMGGDALVGVYVGSDIWKPWAWMSGLVVKTGVSQPPPAGSASNLVVAVLPITRGDYKPHQLKKINEQVGVMLQGTLEIEKGYYVVPLDRIDFQEGIEGAAKLPSEALAALGGKDCQALVEVDLSGKQAKGVGYEVGFPGTIESTAKKTAVVRLFSKQSRRIVWEKGAEGSGATAILLNPLLPNAKIIEAASTATRSAVNSLPDLRTGPPFSTK